jgi:hypothetical protein
MMALPIMTRLGKMMMGGKIKYVTLPLLKLLAKVTPQMKAGRTCHSHDHSSLPSPMTLSSNKGFSQA